MKTVFSSKRKRIVRPYYVRVYTVNGMLTYGTHGSRQEREQFERWHQDTTRHVYRLNVYPKVSAEIVG